MNPKTMRGAFIRERRKGLGLSVDDLAKACDVSCSAIYMWERGDRGENMTVDMALRLSDALQVSIRELAEGVGQRPTGATKASGKTSTITS